MRGVASDLIAETLGWNLRDAVDDALVGLEVFSQPRVVLLDKRFGRALNRLRADLTHCEVLDGDTPTYAIMMAECPSY